MVVVVVVVEEVEVEVAVAVAEAVTVIAVIDITARGGWLTERGPRGVPPRAPVVGLVSRPGSRRINLSTTPLVGPPPQARQQLAGWASELSWRAQKGARTKGYNSYQYVYTYIYIYIYI